MQNDNSQNDKLKFDRLSSKLKGEARSWFFQCFSGLQRNKIKPFLNLLNEFQDQYVDITDEENLQALYKIHNILKQQHNDSFQLIKLQPLDNTP